MYTSEDQTLILLNVLNHLLIIVYQPPVVDYLFKFPFLDYIQPYELPYAEKWNWRNNISYRRQPWPASRPLFCFALLLLVARFVRSSSGFRWFASRSFFLGARTLQYIDISFCNRNMMWNLDLKWYFPNYNRNTFSKKASPCIVILLVYYHFLCRWFGVPKYVKIYLWLNGNLT